MQSQGTRPLVAVLLAVVLIVSLTLINSKEAPPKNADGHASGDDVSAADVRTAAVDEVVDVATPLPRQPSRLGPMVELPPAEREALIASQMAELDQRLRSEPIDGAWARNQEAAIESAIVGSQTDGFDVPMPEDVDKQCRSSLCRIRMTYASEEDALQMQSKLTLGLSGPISKARTFYLPTKDGSTELIVFAGSVGRP